MLKITSHQNPKFKAAVKLHSSRGRKQQNRFLIPGVREVQRAIGNAEIEVAEVLICAELLDAAMTAEVVDRCAQAKVPVFSLPIDLFGKLAYGERVEGLVAIAFRPTRNLDDLCLASKMLIVVVEGIEKPGNLGAVARSADGAGVSALISCDGQTDFFHPNAIRSSIGATLTLPCAEAESGTTRDWLIKNNFSIYAALVGAALTYQDVEYPQRTAIVLGNEASGLSQIWREPPIVPVALPMRGIGDSLNISVAAAILMYEAGNQFAARL